MLKKALTTTVLATVLLTSSISANELATQGFSGSTAKVETIGAFDNIPTQGLNSSELNEKGEWWFLIPMAIGIAPYAYEAWDMYNHYQNQQNNNDDYNDYY